MTEQKLRLKQINDAKVRPIRPIADPDPRPVKGADFFPECNASIFICASRGSGKTTVVHQAIRECIGRNTKVRIFCGNLDKDKSWLAMQKWLLDRGLDYEGYSSIIDPDSGENKLEELVYEVQDRAKEERKKLLDDPENPGRAGARDASSSELEKKSLMKTLMERMFGKEGQASHASDRQDDEEGNSKTPKEKYRTPEYIVVFDDLSDEIRNSGLVAKLLKNGRHFCKIIISSQYFKDLKPEARNNIDYFILFKGLDKQVLTDVYRAAKLSVDFDTFLRIYHDATSERYNFLYIDSRENKFRRNFTHEYMIE